MRILAIETSCDETAAAIVDNEIDIRSSIVASQMSTHGKYGGVVPELASREHLKAIVPVVREAMSAAHAAWPSLDAVAVTVGPGLMGSLLVGLTYAKGLCFARNLPLIGVNHIEGHIHAVILESRRRGDPVEFPAIALIVSGGHTHLFLVTEPGHYRLLGRTRDDAAGEAFDKVGKLLGYGYPGGPIIDQLAPFGDPAQVKFTLVKMKGDTLDFSFSGLKTAVLRWTEADVRAGAITTEIAARKALARSLENPSLEDWLAATPQPTRDMLAAFQFTVIEELLRRASAAATAHDARSIIVSGGVACNSGLRRAASAARLGRPVHFPTAVLSTDNAVMIAAAAFSKLTRRDFLDLSSPARASFPLAP